MGRQTYEYCAACGRHLTTSGSERYLGDRWHPETGWHPLVCSNDECAELVRACEFFASRPFAKLLRGQALRRRRERWPVHRPGCTCGPCEDRRQRRAEQARRERLERRRPTTPPERPARAPERPATQRKPRPGPTSPAFARMCREAKEKRAAARASCWDPAPK